MNPRRVIFLALFLSMLSFSFNVNAQLKLGANPTDINKAALLELKSGNQGLRLTKVDTNAVNSVIASLPTKDKKDATNGMIVFQTKDSSLYFRSGGYWKKVVIADSLLSGSQLSWLLGGNVGTNPKVNFLGTKDEQPLIFKTNGNRVGLLSSSDSNNVIFGRNAYSTKKNAVVIGPESEVNGKHAISIGKASIADETSAIAIGNGVNVTGKYAIGIGGLDRKGKENTQSLNFETIAIGTAAYANGNYSVAIGGHSIAGTTNWSGRSVAIGASAKVKTNHSVGIGYKAQTDAHYTVVVGDESEINKSSYGIVVGPKSYAHGNFSMVLGALSEVNTPGYWGRSIAIGLQDTVTRYYSTVIGIESKVSADTSIAMGYKSLIKGHSSIALGSHTKVLASSTGAMAIGRGAEVLSKSKGAIAFGSKAIANDKYAIAIGRYAQAHGEGSIAIGRHTTANDDYSIILGDDSKSYGWKVGVNTSNPQYNIDVNGTGRVSKALTLGNELIVSNGGGTAGQVLVSQGNNASPKWEDMSGGSGGEGWTLDGNNISDNDFLGTTNLKPLIFKVNNEQVAYFGFAGGGDESKIILGKDASAASGAVAMGAGAQAAGQNSIAIGNTANTDAWAYQGIAIGYNAAAKTNHQALALGVNSVASGQNATAIGSGAVASQNNTVILGDNNVKVGIRTSTPSEVLDVNGNINASGDIKINGVSISSDIRFKKDFKKLENVLSVLDSLNGYTYYFRTSQFKDQNFSKREQIGMIAQEVEKYFPELVSTDEEGYKSLNYAQFSAVLLEAIKEQQSTIKDTKAQQELHQKEMELLKKQVKLLKAQTNSLKEAVAELKNS